MREEGVSVCDAETSAAVTPLGYSANVWPLIPFHSTPHTRSVPEDSSSLKTSVGTLQSRFLPFKPLASTVAKNTAVECRLPLCDVLIRPSLSPSACASPPRASHPYCPPRPLSSPCPGNP